MTRGQILIVDDEVELMNALRETLEGLEYTAHGFSSASPALAALHSGAMTYC